METTDGILVFQIECIDRENMYYVMRGVGEKKLT